MGRKALEKERRPLSPKAELWVRELFPKLQNRSLEKLTLDEIAILINKSKSTIYTYFTTKEEIFTTTVELILKDLEPAVLEEIPKGQNMVELYTQRLTKISDGISGMSIQFIHEIQTYYPMVWTTIKAFTDQILQTFKMIYEEGMRTGEFRKYNTELLMAMDDHFVLYIMTDSSKFSDMSLNEIITEYLDLRLKALTYKE